MYLLPLLTRLPSGHNEAQPRLAHGPQGMIRSHLIFRRRHSAQEIGPRRFVGRAVADDVREDMVVFEPRCKRVQDYRLFGQPSDFKGVGSLLFDRDSMGTPLAIGKGHNVITQPKPKLLKRFLTSAH